MSPLERFLDEFQVSLREVDVSVKIKDGVPQATVIRAVKKLQTEQPNDEQSSKD